MKVVAGVDWSDEAFAAVEQVGLLYRPDEVTLVHGVDLGLFQSPMVAEAANLQGYDDFRRSMENAGREVVARCRTLLPADIPSVQTRCEVHHAASYILDTAKSSKADLIVVGTHDRSRLTEMLVGSVSHHVLLHASCSTLIVKGKARPVKRVLMAVESREDAIRLQTWLTAHPFRNPMAVTILSVVPSLAMVEPNLMVGFQSWSEEHKRQAQQVVQDTARALAGPQFTVTIDVRMGDPVTTVCETGTSHDLIMVSSHGRKGLDRFLLGSVSHGIVHRANVPVLVVR
jgi:nucleotide-binding universal stress UspA family protein